MVQLSTIDFHLSDLTTIGWFVIKGRSYNKIVVIPGENYENKKSNMNLNAYGVTREGLMITHIVNILKSL